MKTHIPAYMLPAFEAQGIDAESLVFAVHTDMTADGSNADVYTALSGETLYILSGEEKVVKTAGARRIVAVFEAFGLESYPLSALSELTSDEDCLNAKNFPHATEFLNCFGLHRLPVLCFYQTVKQ